MFNNVLSPKNCAIYETMQKNVVEPHRSQATILRRMRIACGITKATHTHTHTHTHTENMNYLLIFHGKNC